MPLPHNFIFSRCNELVALLKSCKQVSEFSQIHGVIVKTGLDHDPFTTSKLLAASIQHIPYAVSIFNHIQNPNLFMFNTLLRAYSISDDPKKTFGVFNNLKAQGIMLDQFSFITTLKACARELAIKSGQGIHGVVLRSGHLMFLNLKNALLHMYGVCGRISDARKLFDEFPQENDLVSWNTLMGGYLQACQPVVTMELFRELFRFGLRAGVATLLSVLSAYSDLEDSLGGKSIHGHCIRIGTCSNLLVVTAFIEMYAKTGDMHSGRRIFDEVIEKDVILWNCMIDKYAKVGMLEEAVALLQLMKLEGVKPNSSTLVGLLSACAASRSIKLGQRLNHYIENEGLQLNAILGTALIDMFAKCGFLDKAIDVFEKIEVKDVKSWTSMILSYGAHGQAKNAIGLFCKMEEEGFRPNEVTFLAVLNACSHGGLVIEAVKCFERMVKVYGFSPRIEHYGCIIDLLGRAGLLVEAHDLINSLPIEGDATAWRALLAACRVYGNVELGECVRRMLVKIDNEHPTDSILLSSTYAIAGRLPDNGRWQEMIKEEMSTEIENGSVGKIKKMVKNVGYSTIEMVGHWLEHS